MTKPLSALLCFSLALAAGCGRPAAPEAPAPAPRPCCPHHGTEPHAAAEPTVRLMTLDPGHFHAALVQKSMVEGVAPVVHVYAPEGPDLAQHMERIERFNTRAEDPTAWKTKLYTGPDFVERLFTEKPGNVLVLSGNNAKKTDYILRAVEAGLNVLADKPMAITPKDFEVLQHAFEVAREQGVLLYDIMTERFEITSALQRALSRQPDLFGELEKGTPEAPAITKESVHHFSKMVAGAPLRRPPWFFDITQQGEGIVDVTTHLVDLIQWTAFPGEALSPGDVKVLSAKRWATPMNLAEFEKVTGQAEFPEALRSAVDPDGILHVHANGSFDYTLRGVHAHVSVIWAYEAPPGSQDTHYSILRGTGANLVIRQGAEQAFKTTLYIEPVGGRDPAAFADAVQGAIAALQAEFPGIGAEAGEEGAWVVSVPDRYKVGHEAHFGQVAENFLRYLADGALPDWEVPNMLTKYATIMQAYELSRPKE
jgi:predicted dehydrogenase